MNQQISLLCLRMLSLPQSVCLSWFSQQIVFQSPVTPSPLCVHVCARARTHTHTHTHTSFAADPKTQAERISPFLAKQRLPCMPRSKVRMWWDSEGLSGCDFQLLSLPELTAVTLKSPWWGQNCFKSLPWGPPGSAKGQLWWRLWDGGVSLPRPGCSFWLWCF